MFQVTSEIPFRTGSCLFGPGPCLRWGESKSSAGGCRGPPRGHAHQGHAAVQHRQAVTHNLLSLHFPYIFPHDVYVTHLHHLCKVMCSTVRALAGLLCLSSSISSIQSVMSTLIVLLCFHVSLFSFTSRYVLKVENSTRLNSEILLTKYVMSRLNLEK